MRLLSLLSLVIAITSCVSRDTKDSRVRSVKCDTVRVSSSYADESSFSGVVKAEEEASLSFRVAGQIVQINYKQGEFVRKGDVIAQLDQRDYQVQLSATKAEYSGIKSEVDRVVELYGRNSVTPNEYDKALSAMNQISAKLDSHQNALNDTKLIAPYDGYIERVIHNVGESIAAGMSIVSFISSDKPVIDINIPAKQFLKRGSLISSTATVDMMQDRVFDLELVSTSMKGNLNSLYTTRFRILSPKAPAIGMNATVRLRYSKDDGDDDVTEIPLSALKESSVWVLDEEIVVSRQVEVVNIRADGMVLVKGLSNGDIIVVAGVNSLESGQRVRPLKSSSNSNMGGLL